MDWIFSTTLKFLFPVAQIYRLKISVILKYTTVIRKQFIINYIRSQLHLRFKKFSSIYIIYTTRLCNFSFRITESKNPKFPVGKYVVGQFGWRTHTVTDGLMGSRMEVYLLPDFGDLPLSLALGILGMPG